MNTPVPITVIEALRERIQSLEGRPKDERAVLPFGIKAIDEWLPDGGLALGALHEVAGGGNGAVDGAAAALFAAGIAARTRGRVLWCVVRQDLFAPALALVGLAPDRVIYVEAGDEKSVLACFEEGLRHGGPHGGLGAVVAEVARLSMTASRRLQLAAESSGTIGIAIRRLPRLPRMRGRRISRQSPPPGGGRSARASGPGGGDSASAYTASLSSTAPPPPHPGLPSAVRPSPSRGGWPHAAPLGQWSWVQGSPQSLSSDWPKAGPVGGAPERLGKIVMQPATDFGQPTAAVTRWRVSALPSTPLPVRGVGRARWRLELIRCRGGESAEFVVEACDAQGRLAVPSDLVHGSGQEAIGQHRTAR